LTAFDPVVFCPGREAGKHVQPSTAKPINPILALLYLFSPIFPLFREGPPVHTLLFEVFFRRDLATGFLMLCGQLGTGNKLRGAVIPPPDGKFCVRCLLGVVWRELAHGLFVRLFFLLLFISPAEPVAMRAGFNPNNRANWIIP
jgi:hypothetical protein